jgi:hypothetical protein
MNLQETLLRESGVGPKVDPRASEWVQFLQGHRVEVVAVLACLCLIALVFELVRRHQIKEKYSFLWFLTGTSLIVLTLKRDWLARLSSLVGVYYPPTALFLLLIFFVIVILVHYSTLLTRLLTQNQKLAQKVALLEAEVDALKAQGNDEKAA